ncbi:urea amidolyase associated protein UAAP1 [Acinetobacter calcoaceticus]|uniref:urea amidolyase associated protein UAAP1 n=1 Tax=Acinetobacter calcoaceticus TaxID=471 RepID=UPI001AE3B283|nr:urea amidolyase associated protein UAAP1 [Acinetobacter calcoaceticus]MBP2602800.1 urea carboxylase-associated protein 2 [Acinetobacter calcoaceticus]
MNTANYHNNQAIWTELLPGGHHWSGRIQKGTILRFKSLGAQANVSLFCVNAADVLERFNTPDSLKGQHTAYLKASNVLYSDLGRVMASIVHDDHGWNDALCGPSRPEQIEKQFGTRTFQDARNDMYQNGLDSLLIEMCKYGLASQDLSAAVNLFSKVAADESGALSYVSSDNTDQTIELRFEMDCLLFLSAAPHGLDTSSSYQPADIQLSLFKANSLTDSDICRDACSQNQRAFQNTARYYALSNI